MVDAAYRAKEAAQDKQRKGLDAWRVANKNISNSLPFAIGCRRNITRRCRSWSRFSRQCGAAALGASGTPSREPESNTSAHL